MSKNTKLFGTSGIRGKVKTEVNANLALNVGKSLATYLNNEGTVVIGYDTRTTNKMLECAIISGLMESGVDVIRIGMVPTPLVGYATIKLKADAGIMLTASHNPSQYNGIKLWNSNGMAYTPSQENEIEDIYYNKKYNSVEWDSIGNLEYNEEIKKEYINDLIEKTDIDKKLKVVIDTASGAGSELSPLVFRKIGCEVITLNSQKDGFFPGRKPEPNEDNLKDLMKMVVSTGADLGIAHDGDADRMMAIDDKGRISDFDKLLSIISKFYGGTVITTVDSGLCMDEEMDKVNGKVIRTKVGDVAVAEAINKNNASFGGEPSGTWIHPDFCMCPDGLLSGLKIAEIVSKYGPLSKLLDEIPTYCTIRDKITCSKEDKIKIMNNIEDSITETFDNIKDINTIDGIRLTFNNGSWVLIRPSGTEDYIRITLEGKDTENAKNIHNKSVSLIKNIL